MNRRAAATDFCRRAMRRALRLLPIPLLLALGAFEAQAALTINSVTLNGGASVMVAPGSTISVVITVRTDTTNWRSTGWRISTTPPGTTTCVNHADHDGNNQTFSETFNITAPATEGTYNAYFVVSSNDGCGGTITTGMLSNAVIVNAPPTVSSINRASSDPTTPGASVSWTVTFSEAVTGVDIGDFALSEAGLSGSAITGVSGGGASWTVTATVGAGEGTLGLNLVDNDSIRDVLNMPLGGAGAGNGNATGQAYTVPFSCTPPPGTPPGATCVCDTFDRGNLNPSTIFGANWIVSTSDGTGILPSIVGNRLRLTNNTGGNAKAATLPAMFPAAGNYMSVDFRYYGYNNASGADGIAVALSDYSVPAVPGAFGGSLGYAQKGAGSDCPNCPGFAGGWLGVGIDEYGNFSNPTEGRIGGPGARADSVTVRGSGSGVTGYRYHVNSGSLVPGVDSNSSPGPGHLYRIVVDHSNGANAWTRVERDVGGGLVTVIPQYDAKAQAGQAAVPANWQLSLTGSTGGSTNIHEIDNLRVCATTVWPPSGGTAGDFSAIDEAYGLPAAVQNYLTGHIYLKLVGQPFRLNVAALNNNQIVTSYVVSGNKWVQLKLVDNSDGACVLDDSQPNYCNGACAGKAAVAGGSQVLTYVLANQGQKQSANFTINTAYRNLVAIMRECTNAGCGSFTATPPACSTDSFAVRPLAVTATTSATQAGAGGAPIFRAGSDNFSISATIPGIGGNPSGYDGVLRIGNQTPVLGPVLGGFSPTAFPAATPGTPNASAGGSFNYSEVGVVSLPGYAPTDPDVRPRGIWDDTWSAVDSHPSKNDCIAGSFSNTLSGGKYGCLFGLTAPLSLGRFVPHHFDTEIPNNACGGFTYSGQPFPLRVTARNAAGATTQNYAGALAKAGTWADGNGAAGSFSPATLPAASFTAGVADLTASPQVSFAYANKLTAPTTLRLRVTDADGVSSSAGTEGTTPLRSGRLLLSNAHGSELLGLSMPIQTQYWTGSAWTTNTPDSCTNVSTWLVFSKVPGGMPSPGGGAIVNGKGVLSFPVPPGRGSVEVCANIGADADNPMTNCLSGAGGSGTAPSWLQGSWDADGLYNDNPAARATFGLYEQKSPIIYRRERY